MSPGSGAGVYPGSLHSCGGSGVGLETRPGLFSPQFALASALRFSLNVLAWKNHLLFSDECVLAMPLSPSGWCTMSCWLWPAPSMVKW